MRNVPTAIAQVVEALRSEKNYVLGFLFNEAGDSVALIEHQKFEKLNGIGGTIEEGETHDKAMEREFLEETGALVSADKWRLVGAMRGANYTVVCYTAKGDYDIKTQKEGLVRWYQLSELWSGYPLMENLSWLIPIARDESVEAFLVRNV